MRTPSRQTLGVDAYSVVSILWLLFYALVFYWFYSLVKRIERKLDEIKKLLETRQTA